MDLETSTLAHREMFPGEAGDEGAQGETARLHGRPVQRDLLLRGERWAPRYILSSLCRGPTVNVVPTTCTITWSTILGLFHEFFVYPYRSSKTRPWYCSIQGGNWTTILMTKKVPDSNPLLRYWSQAQYHWATSPCKEVSGCLYPIETAFPWPTVCIS